MDESNKDTTGSGNVAVLEDPGKKEIRYECQDLSDIENRVLGSTVETINNGKKVFVPLEELKESFFKNRRFFLTPVSLLSLSGEKPTKEQIEVLNKRRKEFDTTGGVSTFFKMNKAFLEILKTRSRINLILNDLDENGETSGFGICFRDKEGNRKMMGEDSYHGLEIGNVLSEIVELENIESGVMHFKFRTEPKAEQKIAA